MRMTEKQYSEFTGILTKASCRENHDIRQLQAIRKIAKNITLQRLPDGACCVTTLSITNLLEMI